MLEDLPPRVRTIPSLLERAARWHAGRPLLDVGGVHWRHEDAAAAVSRRAGALGAAGVGRGDRVALMCTNRIEQLETFLACGWIGAIAVPINTASMTVQLDYLLRDSGARLLVTERDFLARMPPGAPPTWVLDESFPPPGDAATPADVTPADPHAILYTSGTTGPSKGVVCPHGQYAAWSVNTADVLGVQADDVLGTTLPLFHVNALNTFGQALVAGCRVAIEPRFSASRFWSTMRAHGATVGYLLGAMVPMLLAQPEHEDERAHRMRIMLGPGVPPAAAAAFTERTGVLLLEGYGSTETNFVLATRRDAPHTGSMGTPRPGFRARVVDALDFECPPGEPGELVVRADEPYAFALGYHGQAEKTVEAWRNLWFHTGDRVVREHDGGFRFIDRIKDAIRRRGENVSSWEVEQALLAHPAVVEAAAFAVSSELAEDEVMVAVVLRAGASVLPKELAAFCMPRLPRFAVPRYVEIVEDLPRTENGKVRKHVLRARGVTAAAWDCEAARIAPGDRSP
jgi:crotonobetaine/carnitine-CoA ligase